MNTRGSGAPRRRKLQCAEGTVAARRGRGRSGAPRSFAAADETRDWSTVEPLAIPLAGLDLRSFISAHFRAYELTRSELAARDGIDNMFPSERELRAAVHLAREVLEPIRRKFGPFTPNSVFRSQALERRLKGKPSGWVSTSQHTRGEACDVEVPGETTLRLAQWAAEHLAAYDQIICECYDETRGPHSGWVHVSLVAPGTGVNRHELLSYIRDPAVGRLVYVPGLRGSLA